jgi:hypothetical protein
MYWSRQSAASPQKRAPRAARGGPIGEAVVAGGDAAHHAGGALLESRHGLPHPPGVGHVAPRTAEHEVVAPLLRGVVGGPGDLHPLCLQQVEVEGHLEGGGVGAEYLLPARHHVLLVLRQRQPGGPPGKPVHRSHQDGGGRGTLGAEPQLGGHGLLRPHLLPLEAEEAAGQLQHLPAQLSPDGPEGYGVSRAVAGEDVGDGAPQRFLGASPLATRAACCPRASRLHPFRRLRAFDPRPPALQLPLEVELEDLVQKQPQLPGIADHRLELLLLDAQGALQQEGEGAARERFQRGGAQAQPPLRILEALLEAGRHAGVGERLPRGVQARRGQRRGGGPAEGRGLDAVQGELAAGLPGPALQLVGLLLRTLPAGKTHVLQPARGGDEERRRQVHPEEIAP